MDRQENLILWPLNLSNKRVIHKVSLPYVLPQENYTGTVAGIWWQIGENQSAKIIVPRL